MISRRMPSYPVLNFSTFLAGRSSVLPFPLDAPTTRMYSSGRLALLEALQILRIRPGDNVLIPSFICSVVVAPFNTLGIRVRYYEVDDHLQPKFETAAHALDSRTRAFLGVHYFGFPQNVNEIMDFCDRHTLYYIEDNAHGFLSASGSRPLGTYGDMSIFSLRKTVALPNGGALVVNNPRLAIESEAMAISSREKTRISTILKFVLRNVALNLDFLPGLNIASFTRDFALRLSKAADEENDLTRYLEKFSTIAKWILARTDFDKEKEVRRRSYFFWHRILENWKAQEVSRIFDELADGVVPLGFPVRVRKRKDFVEELKKQGIECFPWPNLPSEAPRTRLSNEVAIIPLHRYPANDSAIT